MKTDETEHVYQELVAYRGLDGPVIIKCQCGWWRKELTCSAAIAQHAMHAMFMRHATLAWLFALFSARRTLRGVQ